MPYAEWAVRPLRRIVPALGVFALAVLLSGCSLHGNDNKVAHEKIVPVGVSPGAVNKLPENIGEVSVEITNGTFGASEIILQRQGAATVHIVNHDGTAYRFQIVPNLVTATAVAASTTTTISFTSPDAGNYTGQLLPQQGSNVLASINVRIQSAGAVQPS